MTRRVKSRTFILTMLLGAAGIALLAGWRYVQKRDDPARRQAVSRVWNRVVVQPVTRATLHTSVTVYGTIEPFRLVDLRAELVADVRYTFGEVGDWVREGTVLATLDDRDACAVFDAAEADLHRTETDRDRAQQALTRLEGLRDQERASPDPDDQFVRAGDLEDAQLVLQAAVAAVEAAQGRLRQAETTLSRTAIRAPFTGIVTARLADVGDRVTNGQILFSLADLQRFDVTAGLIPEYVTALSPGVQVEVEADSQPGVPMTGTVDAIGVQADERVGTYPMRIIVENPILPAPTFAAGVSAIPTNFYLQQHLAPDERPRPHARTRALLAPDMWRTGGEARIHLPAREYRDALVVPEAAVNAAPGGTSFVIRVDHVDKTVDVFGFPETVPLDIASYVDVQVQAFVQDPTLGPVAVITVPAGSGVSPGVPLIVASRSLPRHQEAVWVTAREDAQGKQTLLNPDGTERTDAP